MALFYQKSSLISIPSKELAFTRIAFFGKRLLALRGFCLAWIADAGKRQAENAISTAFEVDISCLREEKVHVLATIGDLYGMRDLEVRSAEAASTSLRVRRFVTIFLQFVKKAILF